MCAVSALLEKTERSTEHPGRDIKKVKCNRDDMGFETPSGAHTDELFEAPRRGGNKPGTGRPEWVATERVLKILHAHL